ncbi:MAG: ORF6N domain-containing protein [Acidobacteria bacterium]|nr:ORF6N domain-containing protein [Acidobacteriota bacterium]
METKALNQAVARNSERFPKDFCFRLSTKEVEALNRSQVVTGSQKHRNPRYPPRAFSEQGVAMLSSVLRSKQAAEVNVAIMRAFVRLRRMLATNEELARKVARHDRLITLLFDQVDKLLWSPEPKKKRSIGFTHPKDEE